MRGKVGQVEEQRTRLVVLKDDADSLLSKEVRRVMAVTLPVHLHVTPHVIAPVTELQALRTNDKQQDPGVKI